MRSLRIAAALALPALVLLLLVPALATAQENISELTVIYGGNSGIQPPPGFTKINVDLNMGAGGDYIYSATRRASALPSPALP